MAALTEGRTAATRRRRDLPFAERFEILDHLGSGSYADVYLAADRARGERVALKVLHDRVSDSAVWPARERFEREVALMQRLGHPGVVPVLDSGYLPDARVPGRVNPALTMPVVDGETLAAVLERREAQPVAEVVRFLEAVVGVLVHLQEHGVVHRDLGPQNVFRTRDGRFVVSDFGLARPMDAAVVTRLSGTLTDAMAARLLYTDAANRDGVLTSASDLVSVCRVAIALLRGRHYTGPLMPSDAPAVPAPLRELLNRHARDGAEGEPGAFLAALARVPAEDGARRASGAGPQVRVAGAAGLVVGGTQAQASTPWDGTSVAWAAGGFGLATILVIGALALARTPSGTGEPKARERGTTAVGGVADEVSRYVIEHVEQRDGGGGPAGEAEGTQEGGTEARVRADVLAKVRAAGGTDQAAEAAAAAAVEAALGERRSAEGTGGEERRGAFRVRLRGWAEGGRGEGGPPAFGARAAAAAAACGVTMDAARPVGGTRGTSGSAAGITGEEVAYTIPAEVRDTRRALGRPLRIPYCAMAAGAAVPPRAPERYTMLGAVVSVGELLADLRHRAELVAEAEGRFLATHGAFADQGTINADAVAGPRVALDVAVTPPGADGVGGYRVTARRTDGPERCEGTFVGVGAVAARPAGADGTIAWGAVAEAGRAHPGGWTMRCTAE